MTRALEAARSYATQHGLLPPTPANEVAVDWSLAQEIADCFDGEDSAPEDPTTRSQYLAMAEQGAEQFQAIRESGINVVMHRGSGQPYASTRELSQDLDRNRRMAIFPTESGLGPGDVVDGRHPWLETSSVAIDGRRVCHNDVMRAVHDFFGHYLTGSPFTLAGEFVVADLHLQMFTPEIHRAVLHEFAGQIAWFYAGPHLRRTDGTLPTRVDADWTPPGVRPFAAQKVNLLPATWVSRFRRQFSRIGNSDVA